MRTFFGVQAAFAYVAVVMVACSALSFGIYAVTAPMRAAVDRNVVENSKSYTDSNNQAMLTFIQDYNALGVKIAQAQGNTDLITSYKGQQSADVNLICGNYTKMPVDAVSPVVRSFVYQRGGCN